MSTAGVSTDNLIAFWESTLKGNGFLIGISTQVLIRETIGKLKKLQEIEESEEAIKNAHNLNWWKPQEAK